MPDDLVCFAAASSGNGLSAEQMAECVDRFVGSDRFEGLRILIVAPDNTRTAPVGVLFRGLHERLADRAKAFDVMFALGTHPPMSEEAMLRRLAVTPGERRQTYSAVRLMNHAWNDPGALVEIGILSADEIRELSGGRFEMDVPVRVNRVVREYDVAIVIGPVFPHEVSGYSGGNKYFFPGISGPEILNFFHWLGALVTNPMIIGHKWTPVRRVIDRASCLIPCRRLCLAAVVDGDRCVGLFGGTPEAAWEAAADVSSTVNVVKKAKPYPVVLSCAPPMYDELWVAGKCMYKLESVVADGGEIIIYAPHLNEVSAVHGTAIRRIGYHCRDYFLGQWKRFSREPWGVLAHSTHVRGIGTYKDGREVCRIRVTLASRLGKEECAALNLGWRDHRSLDPTSFADRENEGVLCVQRAGERLYRLECPPAWAAG